MSYHKCRSGTRISYCTFYSILGSDGIFSKEYASKSLRKLRNKTYQVLLKLSVSEDSQADLYFIIDRIQFLMFKNGQQLALGQSRPIAYRLPNCELIASLPYAENNSQPTPAQKNIVKYMIKSEENLMKTEQNYTESSLEKLYEEYLPKIPATPFLDSEKFIKLYECLEHRQSKTAENQTEGKKQKQGYFLLPDIPVAEVIPEKPKRGRKPKVEVSKVAKLNQKQIESNSLIVESGMKWQMMNVMRENHLLASDQLTPVALKAIIASIEKQKETISRMIASEKGIIQEKNKVRRYEHLEAEEREETVRDRVKIMVNKRRRLNEFVQQ